MPLMEHIHALREKILKLAKECGIWEVMVFGSVARGEETPESDIDVLIDLERPVQDAFGFLDSQTEMQRMFGQKVDMVFKSGLYHRIKDRVLREAQPV